MKPRKVKGGKWQLAGVVGVDSGRLLITDYPDHPTVKNDAVTQRLLDEAERQGLHGGDLPRLLAIPYQLGHMGAGVSVSAGLGDGLYDVWALIGEVFINGNSWGKRVCLDIIPKEVSPPYIEFTRSFKYLA